MIAFTTNDKPGYADRTRINVICSDITVAIAADLDSAGEILTRKIAYEKGLPYIAVEFCTQSSKPTHSRADVLNISSTIRSASRFGTSFNLNVAGNGLSRLNKHSKYKSDHIQKLCDEFAVRLIADVVEELKESGNHFSLIRSGGQTGFDESGLKAATKLGIPALCHAPADWRFRPGDGFDICDEMKFKARFD